MKTIQGRNIIAVILLRMGLASLARSLSHLATTRLVDRFCVAAFHPNIGTYGSKRFSSLYGSRLQSSSLSSSSRTSDFGGAVVSSQSLLPPLSPLDENYFLHQVEVTISNVFSSCSCSNGGVGGGGGENNIPSDVDILDLPVEQREAFGVARHVDKRLRSLRKNNDCPRCWMQRYHCICEDCAPVVVVDSDKTCENNLQGSLKRIFLVVHHKEIGLKVDTAKLILAAFPFQCELVVGGIGPEHQTSMNLMLESIRDSKRMSLLLFPDETAKTLEEIVHQKKSTCSTTTEASLRDAQPPESGNNHNDNDIDDGYDLIVLDGTWAQARKFHSRYFPPDDNNSSPSSSSSLQRVKLSEASVELLHNGSIESGHQLRRHEIPWRQVGTFEAFRLFLRDWSREFPSHNENNNENDGGLEFWEQIESYQRIGNDAALKELGPPRS